MLGILGELSKGGLLDLTAQRVNGSTLGEDIQKYDITAESIDAEADRIYHSAPSGKFCTQMGAQDTQWPALDTDRATGCIRSLEHAYTKDGGLAVLFGNIAQDGCVVKTAGVDESLWHCPRVRLTRGSLRGHLGRKGTSRRRRSDYARRS